MEYYNEDYEDERYYESYNEREEYERDTFYALGGEDYEQWRDNGGDIDSLMDSLGF